MSCASFQFWYKFPVLSRILSARGGKRNFYIFRNPAAPKSVNHEPQLRSPSPDEHRRVQRREPDSVLPHPAGRAHVRGRATSRGREDPVDAGGAEARGLRPPRAGSDYPTFGPRKRPARHEKHRNTRNPRQVLTPPIETLRPDPLDLNILQIYELRPE